MQPGRRELLQVLGAGEEIEDFVQRPRDKLLGAENIRLGLAPINISISGLTARQPRRAAGQPKAAVPT